MGEAEERFRGECRKAIQDARDLTSSSEHRKNMQEIRAGLGCIWMTLICILTCLVFLTIKLL